MVAEIRPDYPSQWAAICEVSGKLGIGTPETLRTWIRRAEVDSGSRPGVRTEQAAEVAWLKRENAELAEQHDDWIEGRRYLGLDVLARSRTALINTNETATE